MSRLLFILCLALSGCALDVRDSNPGPAPEPEFDSLSAARTLGLNPPKQLVGPYHSIRVGEKANDYSVQLRLPEATRIERLDVTTNNTAIVTSASSAFEDRGVEPGHKYEYRLNTTRGQLSFRVEVPLDLEVLAPTVLASGERFEYRRMIFGPQGSLVTNGRSVEITTEELIAQRGARIESFLNGSRAVDGTAGRSGGSLQINILNARGDLVIDVSGENGGNGLAGVPHTERAPSGANMPGFDNPQNCTGALRRQGPQGQGGLPGFPGGNAGNGGHSGSLTIKIGGKADFRYSVVKRVGEAGTGGVGGPGQLGGLGGFSEMDRMPGLGASCPSPFPRGPAGPTGPKGPDGQPSLPGQDLGKVCLIDLENSSCR